MAEAEGSHWILGLAASAQLAVGIASYRRGLRGSSDPALMPFKAFVAASLFVGAGATGCLLLLRSAGICKVEQEENLFLLPFKLDERMVHDDKDL